MPEFEKGSKRYQTDLTHEEWLFSQAFLPPLATHGRKPATNLRDVLDALRYLARTGGGWRMLPTTSRLDRKYIGASVVLCDVTVDQRVCRPLHARRRPQIVPPVLL